VIDDHRLLGWECGDRSRPPSGPLLAEPLPSADGAARFLDDLAADLRSRGVNTVSLVGPLRQAAASGLGRGEYIYWRDDTHWNPRGIRIAAEAIERR
jgi:hypothetical protein